MISVPGRCEVFDEPIHPNIRRPVRHNEENIDSDYEYISEDEIVYIYSDHEDENMGEVYIHSDDE